MSVGQLYFSSATNNFTIDILATKSAEVWSENPQITTFLTYTNTTAVPHKNNINANKNIKISTGIPWQQS